MKKLNAFTIQIEKYEKQSNEQIKEYLKNIAQIKEQINLIKQNKVLKDEVGIEPFQKSIKKLRESLKESNSYYRIVLTHKNTKEELDDYVDTRSEVNKSIVELSKRLQETVKNKRLEYTKLKRKSKKHNGFSYFLIGLTHQRPGAILKIKEYTKCKAIFNSKRPETEDNYIGVEIECYIQGTKDQIAMDIYQHNPELINKVCLKSDGSLRPKDNEKGVEFAILDKEEGIGQTIIDLMDSIKHLKPRVDDTCGLHVHLDMRYKIAEVSFHNLVKASNVLFKMQPEKRKENNYCTPNRYLNIYKYMESSERYYAINPTSIKEHNTIEVRLHEGCVDALRINKWINLLVSISSKTEKVAKKYRALKSLCTDFKVDKDVEDYSEKLIKQYEVA